MRLYPLLRARLMCGIAALISGTTDPASSTLASALSSLGHRGPDGAAAAATGRVVLGHARLAIVDVSGGAQPMWGEDGRVALVCNGEIYNHRRLRALLGQSHRLATHSDSEVVLHLYEDLGASCVHELDGMFAFVVTDGRRFVAARDPFGIKPLYVGWHSIRREVWFASEFKALIPHCDGFMALPPGTYLTQSGQVEQWFAPGWVERMGTDRPASLLELSERLETAVVKRLMSDVPLGVFLSGGLDSTIVAALARRHIGGLQTFAVGMAGAADLELARQAASSLGTRHHECVYSLDEAAKALVDIIYHLESYDPALIRSAVPCYFLSRLAAQSVKVVLTGEGADELFGGYSFFSEIRAPAQMHRECVSLVLGLHGMNLQRVDRMTMAHGLEGRVPFLDREFVAWSMNLDPGLKLWGSSGLEKRLLRDAFQSALPAAVLQRRKLEFGAGSNSEEPLRAYAEQTVTDRDLSSAHLLFPDDPPRTKEELLYRRCFEELFPGPWPRANVQRWQRGANRGADSRAPAS